MIWNLFYYSHILVCMRPMLITEQWSSKRVVHRPELALNDVIISIDIDIRQHNIDTSNHWGVLIDSSIISDTYNANWRKSYGSLQITHIRMWIIDSINGQWRKKTSSLSKLFHLFLSSRGESRARYTVRSIFDVGHVIQTNDWTDY